MKKEIIVAGTVLTLLAGCTKPQTTLIKEPVLFHPVLMETPNFKTPPLPVIEAAPEPEPEEVITDYFTITHYCGCDICNGEYGAYDALGNPLVDGTIACNVLPLGAEVLIDGMEYTVRDRLSSVYNGQNRIDIYVSDHDLANELGIRYDVEVIILDN